MSENKITLNPKIIVIDDSRTIRVEVTAILKSMGFSRITEAEDGVDAWSKMSAEASVGEPFDLILSDINMPKMNGIDLLIKYRTTSVYKLTAAMMISAESEKMTILQAISQGADDYILKPFDRETVKGKILKLLQSRL